MKMGRRLRCVVGTRSRASVVACPMTRNAHARTRGSASLPSRRPILIATKDMLFRGQDTSLTNRIRAFLRLSCSG